MPRMPPRPFRLSDGLILIAATALGLAPYRNVDFEGLSKAGAEAVIALGPLLVTWSAAVAWIGGRVPRGAGTLERRRVRGRPGVAACRAAVLCVLIYATPFLPVVVWGPTRADLLEELTGEVLFNATAPAGVAVLAVWIDRARGGRWAPERSWLDRLGRLLGVVWIAAGLVGLHLRWLLN